MLNTGQSVSANTETVTGSTSEGQNPTQFSIKSRNKIIMKAIAFYQNDHTSGYVNVEEIKTAFVSSDEKQAVIFLTVRGMQPYDLMKFRTLYLKDYENREEMLHNAYMLLHALMEFICIGEDGSYLKPDCDIIYKVDDIPPKQKRTQHHRHRRPKQHHENASKSARLEYS